MKYLLPTIFIVLLSSIVSNCVAQSYRNCTITFYAVGKDSVSISAQSKEATVEVNMQSGEILLKVKIKSFTTENMGLANELKEYNEKLQFKGLLKIEPGKELFSQSPDVTNTINGSTKINGIKMPTTASYSVFQKSNSAGNNQPPLINLEFTVLLSEFNIAEHFPKLMNEVKISLVRQPLNVVME